jgi:hypothetical protein
MPEEALVIHERRSPQRCAHEVVRVT